jgi:hypothetical protein
MVLDPFGKKEGRCDRSGLQGFEEEKGHQAQLAR